MNIVFKCGQLFSTSDLLVMCKALWSFHCHLQQVSLAEPLRGAGITSKVSKGSGSAIVYAQGTGSTIRSIMFVGWWYQCGEI